MSWLPRVCCTLALGALGLGCHPPPSIGAPPSAASSSPLVQRLLQVTGATRWRLVSTRPLAFDAFHPQGMVKVGDVFFLSSVEILEKRRGPADGGRGVGHLFKLDATGALLGHQRLGEGALYHPGGIDFDGARLWVPVAEYRPDSRARVYRVDPETLEAAEILRAPDHVGALVRDSRAGELIGFTWGARRFLRFNGAFALEETKANPSSFLEYQDCHAAGDRLAICTGLQPIGVRTLFSGLAGGVAVLDLRSLSIVRELPLELRSPRGNPATRNPAVWELEGKRLRLHCVPDDGRAALLTYEAEDT